MGLLALVVTKGGEIVGRPPAATMDASGKDISYDFKAQVRQLFRNIDADLHRVGGSLSDLVSVPSMSTIRG